MQKLLAIFNILVLFYMLGRGNLIAADDFNIICTDLKNHTLYSDAANRLLQLRQRTRSRSEIDQLVNEMAFNAFKKLENDPSSEGNHRLAQKTKELYQCVFGNRDEDMWKVSIKHVIGIIARPDLNDEIQSRLRRFKTILSGMTENYNHGCLFNIISQLIMTDVKYITEQFNGEKLKQAIIKKINEIIGERVSEYYPRLAFDYPIDEEAKKCLKRFKSIAQDKQEIHPIEIAEFRKNHLNTTKKQIAVAFYLHTECLNLDDPSWGKVFTLIKLKSPKLNNPYQIRVWQILTLLSLPSHHSCFVIDAMLSWIPTEPDPELSTDEKFHMIATLMYYGCHGKHFSCTATYPKLIEFIKDCVFKEGRLRLPEDKLERILISDRKIFIAQELIETPDYKVVTDSLDEQKAEDLTDEIRAKHEVIRWTYDQEFGVNLRPMTKFVYDGSHFNNDFIKIIDAISGNYKFDPEVFKLIHREILNKIPAKMGRKKATLIIIMGLINVAVNIKTKDPEEFKGRNLISVSDHSILTQFLLKRVPEVKEFFPEQHDCTCANDDENDEPDQLQVFSEHAILRELFGTNDTNIIIAKLNRDSSELFEQISADFATTFRLPPGLVDVTNPKALSWIGLRMKPWTEIYSRLDEFRLEAKNILDKLVNQHMERIPAFANAISKILPKFRSEEGFVPDLFGNLTRINFILAHVDQVISQSPELYESASIRKFKLLLIIVQQIYQAKSAIKLKKNSDMEALDKIKKDIADLQGLEQST